jgi:hypothetical protein
MVNTFGIFLMLFFMFTSGGLLGYSIGKANEQRAIAECEKELPRNVQCTIMAVPVDKN